MAEASMGTVSSWVNRVTDAARKAANQKRQAEAYIPPYFNLGRTAAKAVSTIGSAGSSGSTYRAPAASYTPASSGGGGSSSGGSRAWSSGGGGGGGGGGVAYVAPQVDTRIVNGPYAPKYLQSGADAIAEDPAIMLYDLVQRFAGSDGMGDNAIYSQLEPYMDLMNPLFMASNGNNDAVGANKEAWVNWLGAQIDAMLTPGQYTDVAPAINNVLNPAENSLLRNFIAQGTASEQARNTNSLLSAAAAMGLHPGFQKSVRNRLDEAQQAYLAASAKGPVDPFYQYLNETIPDLARLLPGAK